LARVFFLITNGGKATSYLGRLDLLTTKDDSL